MRLILCSILLLCGCSTANVRCDSHLQPINLAAAGNNLPPAAQAPVSGRGP